MLWCVNVQRQKFSLRNLIHFYLASQASIIPIPAVQSVYPKGCHSSNAACILKHSGRPGPGCFDVRQYAFLSFTQLRFRTVLIFFLMYTYICYIWILHLIIFTFPFHSFVFLFSYLSLSFSLNLNFPFFRLNSNISLQLPVTTHHTHLLQVKISEISYSEFLAGQF